MDETACLMRKPDEVAEMRIICYNTFKISIQKKK